MISRSLHFNKTNKPIQQNKMVIKKIMKRIDLRCRCCDNNPLRKSSISSENSCRFFACGIVLAQFFALQFCKFSRQLAGRNSRLRLNDFRSLQSTNPSVPHCIQQFHPFCPEIDPQKSPAHPINGRAFLLQDSVYYGCTLFNSGRT